MPTHPTAFISYSWDDEAHKEWVRQLATQLRADGVDARLDHWHAVPGDQLPEFMEREIRENDYVLIICTPKYKVKSDKRTGGVGYEGDIMTAEVLTKQTRRKFIPVLAKGSWAEAAPSWLLGTYHVDLSDVYRYPGGYQDLLTTILSTRPKPPPLGPPPPGYTSPAHSQPAQQDAFERVTAFCEYALKRFSKVVAEDKLDIAKIGFLDMALVIDGDSDRTWLNNQLFLSALIPAHPNLPGFWIWKVNRSNEPWFNPYTIGETYEQHIFISPAKSVYRWGLIDFTIFEPSGRFLHRKAFVSDLLKANPQARGKFFDPLISIVQVSEAFWVGSAYAKALGYGPATQLRFRFRWSGLDRRQLKSFFRPEFDPWSAQECRDDEVSFDLIVPLELSKQEVIQKTTQAIQRVARAFGGYIFPEATVRNEVTKQLNQT